MRDLAAKVRALRGAWLLLFFCFLLGCGPSEPAKSSESDPLIEVYGLIDQGKFPEARTKALRLQSEEPRDEVEIALASIYAAEAGVDVSSHVRLARVFQLPGFREHRPRLLPLSSEARGVLEKSSRELLEIILAIDEVLYRFRLLPQVNQTQAEKLIHALEILEPVTSRHRGAALYSATLEMILFRSSLDTQVWRRVRRSSGEGSTRCEWRPLSEMLDQLEEAFVFPLLRLSSLLSKAYPSQEPRFSQQADLLLERVEQVQVEVTDLGWGELEKLWQRESSYQGGRCR